MAHFCPYAADYERCTLYDRRGQTCLFQGMVTEDKQTVLEIRDEGVGIPAGDLPRVFDAYFTGVNGRTFHNLRGWVYIS